MPSEPAITILGEKGQIVIPKKVREQLHVGPRTRFVVFGSGDVIILKRLELPELGSKWRKILASLDAKGLEISEREVGTEVTEARRARGRRNRK